MKRCERGTWIRSERNVVSWFSRSLRHHFMNRGQVVQHNKRQNACILRNACFYVPVYAPVFAPVYLKCACIFTQQNKSRFTVPVYCVPVFYSGFIDYGYKETGTKRNRHKSCACFHACIPASNTKQAHVIIIKSYR